MKLHTELKIRISYLLSGKHPTRFSADRIWIGCMLEELSKCKYWVAFNQWTDLLLFIFACKVQVNLCQKLLFLHQLTHNMTTYCSLNYKFNTWKLQAQTWGEHVVYRNCFYHSEQFLYTTCSPHVLQKEELLTKIYL